MFYWYPGIIVAGPPGSGKSSIIQTLVQTLCMNPRGLSRGSARTRASDMADTNHKLLRICPLVADGNLEQIFGYVNQNHDWVDGIFTSAFRKANRVSSPDFVSIVVYGQASCIHSSNLSVYTSRHYLFIPTCCIMLTFT